MIDLHPTPNLSLIVACAQNMAIGKDNDLLWHIGDDLKRFKALTTGHTIIMGRKTFDSLPKGALPNRRNVVVSRSLTTLPGCDVYPSLTEALSNTSPNEDVYIIGGATIYEQALPLADRLCLTEINDTPKEADVFFPDYSTWKEVWREDHDKDEKHNQQYSFVDYVK